MAEAKMSARQQLVDFLGRKARRPVLNAKLDDYSGREREEPAHLQRTTETEPERYRHHGSAEKVVKMFTDDLDSEPPKRVLRELHRLKLPSLDDVRDEFLELAQRLGIRSER